MPNATIDTIIDTLATVALDGTATDTYQDEVFTLLARQGLPGVLVQVDAAFLAATAGTAEYTLPSGHRTPLILGYDELQMQGVRFDELQFFDPAWRDQLGYPIAYTFDPVNRDRFQVMPVPQVTGATIGGNTPVTFTAPFPWGNFLVISAISDTTYSGTPYVDTFLAVAFEVLAREFARDSDHHDPDASGIAAQMANLFWHMSFPEVSRGEPA